MKNTKYNFDYKSIHEMESLSPEELIAYHNKIINYYKHLLDEAHLWKDTYKYLQLEMNDRIDALDKEIMSTETDRIEQNEALYDILCRIH